MLNCTCTFCKRASRGNLLWKREIQATDCLLRARQTKPHSVDTFVFYCALSCIRLLKQTQNILGLMRPKYAFGMLCGQLQNFTTIYSMCLKYWPPLKYHHFLLLPLSAGIAKGYLYKKKFPPLCHRVRLQYSSQTRGQIHPAFVSPVKTLI